MTHKVQNDLYKILKKRFEYRNDTFYYIASKTKVPLIAGRGGCFKYCIDGVHYLASKCIYLYHHKEVPRTVYYNDKNKNNLAIENLVSKLMVNVTPNTKPISKQDVLPALVRKAILEDRSAEFIKELLTLYL